MALSTPALLSALLLFSSALAAPHRRPVAHDDNMKDHIQGNKFLLNNASDDHLAYPSLNDEALASSRCPKQVELRWQTEVSSSIYATSLITDLNTYSPYHFPVRGILGTQVLDPSSI